MCAQSAGLSLPEEGPLTAEEVLDRHLAVSAVASELAIVDMVTSGGEDRVGEQRRLVVLFDRGENGHYRYILRFLAPEDIAGTTLLTVEGADGEATQHVYLPAFQRVVAVSGAMRRQRFLESDFTYDDFRRRPYEDLEVTLLPEPTIVDARPCFVLEAVPSPDAGAATKVYPRRVVYIDAQDFALRQVDYFGPDGVLAKTLRAFDYRSVGVEGQTRRPRRAMMIDHLRGSRSVMTVVRSRINLYLPPDIFTAEGIAGLHPARLTELFGAFEWLPPQL